jgi:chromosome segregation ATPase
MAFTRAILTLFALVALALPAHARKDKTRGLPPARGNNVPEVDMQPMRDAKLRLGQVEGKIDRAQDALNKTIDDLRHQSEASLDVAAAQAALRQAQSDYDAATAPILEEVRSTPQYEAALDAKKSAAQHVEDLQNESPPDQDQITQAARAVLDKGQVLTKMQNAALASDPKITSLKANLDAANQKLLKLRYDLDESIKTNPQVMAARKELEEAQSELPPVKTAYDNEQQKYDQAMAAREKALNDSSNDDNRPSTSTGGGKRHKKKLHRRRA